MATRYVVLKRENSVWELAGSLEADGADSAARSLAQAEELEGTFVAIPARSFKPLDIRLEQRPRAVVVARVGIAG